MKKCAAWFAWNVPQSLPQHAPEPVNDLSSSTRFGFLAVGKLVNIDLCVMGLHPLSFAVHNDLLFLWTTFSWITPLIFILKAWPLCLSGAEQQWEPNRHTHGRLPFCIKNSRALAPVHGTRGQQLHHLHQSSMASVYFSMGFSAGFCEGPGTRPHQQSRWSGHAPRACRGANMIGPGPGHLSVPTFLGQFSSVAEDASAKEVPNRGI